MGDWVGWGGRNQRCAVLPGPLDNRGQGDHTDHTVTLLRPGLGSPPQGRTQADHQSAACIANFKHRRT